jgi:predicted ATPase
MYQLDLSEGVREVIGRRLSRLTDAARRLLDKASVIGVEIPLEELTGSRAAPDGETLDLLGEAARAEVLFTPARAGGAWRFKHALIREVLYRALPAHERMRLHRDAAATLQDLHRTDPDPPLASLAHHFIEAVPMVDSSVAVDHARRAAAQATAQAAHEESVRLYSRALTVATDRDALRVQILIELGEAATRAGDVRAAQKADLEAADLAEKLGQVEEPARAAGGYGGPVRVAARRHRPGPRSPPGARAHSRGWRR